MVGVIPGLWSLLRYPVTAARNQVVAAERRFAEVEERAVQNVKTSITDRVLAIEEQLLVVERRVEDNVKAAIRERLTEIEDRLATVRARVVEDLKRELRHLMLKGALWVGAAALALLGAALLLTSVWLTLNDRFGATIASSALGVTLLAVSFAPIGILRLVVNRSLRLQARP